MIQFTLLGTAAAIPLPERALTAGVLSCGGHSLLIDCGEGTQTAARRAHISLMKTDAICLTHYHGDHIFGLPGLLQTMGLMGRTEPLYLIGPEGLEYWMRPILMLAAGLPFEVRLFRLPKEGICLSELGTGWTEGARLTPIPTQHRIPSQGYCFTLARAGRFLPQQAKALGIPVTYWKYLQRGEEIEWNGQRIQPAQVMGQARQGLKLVYSGDTAPCESLEQMAKGADLFVCEATYGEEQQGELAVKYGHSTFARTAQMAANAEAKQLWLVHFSQMLETPADYLPNAQAFFPDAELGEDGKSILLRFVEE